MADCEHCKDPWQKWVRAPDGEYMHRAVHGCEIVWNKCRNGKDSTQIGKSDDPVTNSQPQT